MLKMNGQMFPVILSLFDDAGMHRSFCYMISGGVTSATVIPASAVIIYHNLSDKGPAVMAGLLLFPNIILPILSDL